ncbi:MAG TPA: hypothetical protein VHW43_14020, partial [Puia sp.]|nr:hypothetical protein [Puia sp.]
MNDSIDAEQPPLVRSKQGQIARAWIEKTIVSGRIDREQGPHRLGAALWSPQKSTNGGDIYANMRNVLPGDIVLHLTDNLGITGTSRVTSQVDDSFRGVDGSEWADRPGYRVQLEDYQPLTPPLSRAMFFDDPEVAEQLKQISAPPRSGGLFFNGSMELRQGAYLTEASPALFKILNNAYRKHTGSEIPGVPASLVAASNLIPDANRSSFSNVTTITGEDISLLR